MSFDPRLFYLVAKSIGRGNADEAALRTAVGRSYYAAFLVARDRMGLSSEKVKVHFKVESELKRRGKLALGQKLGQLKRLRVKADYRLATADWNNIWKSASALSNDLLKKL